MTLVIDSRATTGDAIRMRRGMLWFLAGSALLIGTYTLSTSEAHWILTYGLLVVGLYLVVLGLEKMAGGYLAGARTGDREIVRSVRRTGAACLLVAVLAGAAGSIAYSSKVPYWNSIRSLAAGMEAAPPFLEIIERHAESLESGVAGEDLLRLWRESAAAGLALREEISNALEGARYLAEHADGDLRAQAESIEPFYSACMEWIRFYEGIDRAFREESMTEPKDDWPAEHDRLHQRLHDVQPHSIEGS